jgi:SAM-dependent methyltransferase
MAHPQQTDFCLSVKKKFPSYFKGGWVLDIGSLDINGNNQYLFENAGYIGVDLLPGKNVDFTSKAHELQFPDSSFDVIISTECFEHDPYYELSIINIVRMLKPGGLFLFTCATTGRPEHGTRRTTPDDAPFTQSFGNWGDYYKNLEAHHIEKAIDCEACFQQYEFLTQHETHDLYFWGLKQGEFLQREDYSFLMSGSSCSTLAQTYTIEEAHLSHQIFELNRLVLKKEDQLAASIKEVEARDMQIRIGSQAATTLHCQISELNKTVVAQALRLDRLLVSRSWRVTRPLRFLSRFVRGQYDFLSKLSLKVNQFGGVLPTIRRICCLIGYIFRADLNGLRSKLNSNLQYFSPAEANDIQAKGVLATWAVITPEHTLFIAHLICERLNIHGWSCEVMTSPPDGFSHDCYIVLCPQAFNKLPPGKKRIAFQLEQSTSSRWFTDAYFHTLKHSLAVLDYSLTNIKFLAENGIFYPHVYYLPIGASYSYGISVSACSKKYDVLFYGDALSSPRRVHMLDILKQHFNVHVVNNLFGEAMIQTLKEAKVVLNLHYYENSLLEMPRIQECLSLGLTVVSESTLDLEDYPELHQAVIFFDEGSVDGMIEAVAKAINTSQISNHPSVDLSSKRFSFMFDRFLIAMNLLPSSHVETITLPLPTDRDVFGLSLPETIDRRLIFKEAKPANCEIFDGIRYKPGWTGCGLSYAALARHALGNHLSMITVMEDDVILPNDYEQAFGDIKRYLQSKGAEWDIFAGLIAVLHPATEVLDVEEFCGRTFVTINKMTSMVFNVYSAKALGLLSTWDSEDGDVGQNTIDRFLENMDTIRVITTLPFFVGHREEVHSTLWGFENSRYKDLITHSEAVLRQKVSDFNATRSRA